MAGIILQDHLFPKLQDATSIHNGHLYEPEKPCFIRARIQEPIMDAHVACSCLVCADIGLLLVIAATGLQPSITWSTLALNGVVGTAVLRLLMVMCILVLHCLPQRTPGAAVPVAAEAHNPVVHILWWEMCVPFRLFYLQYRHRDLWARNAGAMRSLLKELLRVLYALSAVVMGQTLGCAVYLMDRTSQPSQPSSAEASSQSVTDDCVCAYTVVLAVTALTLPSTMRWCRELVAAIGSENPCIPLNYFKHESNYHVGPVKSFPKCAVLNKELRIKFLFPMQWFVFVSAVELVLMLFTLRGDLHIPWLVFFSFFCCRYQEVLNTILWTTLEPRFDRVRAPIMVNLYLTGFVHQYLTTSNLFFHRDLCCLCFCLTYTRQRLYKFFVLNSIAFVAAAYHLAHSAADSSPASSVPLHTAFALALALALRGAMLTVTYHGISGVVDPVLANMNNHAQVEALVERVPCKFVTPLSVCDDAPV